MRTNGRLAAARGLALNLSDLENEQINNPSETSEPEETQQESYPTCFSQSEVLKLSLFQSYGGL